jgi:hypothetical protein
MQGFSAQLRLALSATVDEMTTPVLFAI